MAQRILGIDLGARTVKLVLLQSTFRAFTVLDHVRAELPPAGEPPGAPLLARQAAALGELLAARAWPLDEAVVALPGSGISSAVITLPFTDPHRIEQTLPFEVEGQIPFELSAVAWDWQSLGVREGRSDLLVDVVRREDYFRHNDPAFSDCERKNADSHLRGMIMGQSLCLQVRNSTVLLGTWQSIILAEFDGPRSRSMSIQVSGI